MVGSGHADHAPAHHHCVRLGADPSAVNKEKLLDIIIMTSAKVAVQSSKLNKSMSPLEIAFCLGSSVVSRLDIACDMFERSSKGDFNLPMDMTVADHKSHNEGVP